MAATSTVDVPLGSGDPKPTWLISKPSLVALAIGLLAIISSAATYASLTGLISYTPDRGGLIFLLIVNLTLVLALGALIAWRLTRVWAERRSGGAGARLHVRLVAMFSAVAIIPAILVAIFAAVTLNLGVEAWFSSHVRSALESAVNVTHRYGDEKQGLIVIDAREIAKDIQRDPQLFDANGKADVSFLFSRLQMLTEDHGLQAAYILNGKGQVLGSSKLRSLPDLQPPSASEIAQAARGPVLIDANSKIGVLRALVRLDALNDAYLLVVRRVDPQVFAYYQSTVDAVGEYKRLDRDRAKYQLVFAALYAVVSLLILLAAIWLGLWAANRLVNPISRLIGAAERVSEGDLKAQVEIDREDDEIGDAGPRLQPHDGAARCAAHRTGRGKPSDRCAAPVHRSGARGRQRRRHRPRRRGQDHHRQPRRGAPVECDAGRDRRPALCGSRAGTGGAHPARAAGTRRPRERRSDRQAWRHGSQPERAGGQRRGQQAVSSSPSTTSPISSRRSAPPPGPMSRDASRTRSRIR